MYCVNCGTHNADTNRFCLQCGKPLMATPVSLQEPSRGGWIPPGAPATMPRSPQRRFPWLWFISGGLIVVALLCVGGYLLARQWLRLGTNEAVKLMPADTMMMMSLSPGPLQVSRLQNLAPLSGVLGAVMGETGAAPMDLGAQSLDIDFARDIQPWIGLEAVAGIVDTGAGEPALVAAVASRSSRESAAFLKKVRTQMEGSGAVFEEERYSGILVVYKTSGDSSDQLAYAEVNRFVIAATSLDGLHALIDAAQGKQTALPKNSTYQRMMKELSGNRFGYLYADWATIRKMGGSEELDRLAGDMLQAVGAALVLENDGLRLDYVMLVNPDSIPDAWRVAMEMAANPNKVTAALPEDTLVMYSGQKLRLLFDQIADVAGLADVGGESLMTQIERSLGINLEQDLFGWADGEYALALISDPDSEGPLGILQMPANLLLLIETKDDRVAERGMQNIADALTREGGSQFNEEKIGGVTFHTITDPYQATTIGYGLVNHFVVIGTSHQVLREVATAADQSLARDDAFRNFISRLPARNSGYVYMNVELLVDTVYEQMPEYAQKDFDASTRPYLKSVRAIGLANQQPGGKDVQRGSMFLLLARNVDP